MQRSTRVGMVSAVALLGLVCGSSIAQGKVTKLSDLSWMAGSWALVNDRVRIEERWTPPAGGMMLGTERTISIMQEKVVEFEFLRLEERADGIYYVAHPQARPGTDFKLVRASASEAVFENRAHDFPKRVLYRKNPDGSLTASIDDGGDPPKKEVVFPYKRAD